MSYKILFEACKSGSLETVKRQIENGLDAKFSQSLALRLAAGNNHLPIVEYLLPYSDAKAQYSEAFVFAAGNKNTKMIDLLCNVCDPFAKDNEYLEPFYTMNIFGLWKYVLQFANGNDKKIEPAMWISCILRSDEDKCDMYKQVTDLVCSIASDKNIIVGIAWAIKDGGIMNSDFFDKLLNQVKDPSGSILNIVLQENQRPLVSQIVTHTTYNKLFPTLDQVHLDKSLELVIDSADALSATYLLPYTSNFFSKKMIMSLVKTDNQDLWDMIITKKSLIDPRSPENASEALAEVSLYNPKFVFNVCKQHLDLNVLPIAAKLAHTRNDEIMNNLILRCDENDLLKWMMSKEYHDKNLYYVKELYAQQQRERLLSNIDTNIDTKTKKM